ncbi:prepilin-type N-terminal cleavage/methylation domain-containing protein [uncultured Nitrospira sp.]|uniref:type IV pilus modification PilV family protein n=1 Tax=uncultured Nitrospira sp. TaxID=157176 RepID=UPI00313FFDAD
MKTNIHERYPVRMCLCDQRGFSLLEVLMALVVVFMALLGFAGYSVVAHTGMTASEKMTRAVTLAQEKIEDVRRGGVPISVTDPWINIEPYGSMAGAMHHQRTLTIQPHTPITGLHTVTVEVRWDHDAHTTTLTTYLTK